MTSWNLANACHHMYIASEAVVQEGRYNDAMSQAPISRPAQLSVLIGYFGAESQLRHFSFRAH